MKKIAFTIVTKNYLWAAKVLAQEYFKHSKDTELYIVVTDIDPSETVGEEIHGAKILPGSAVYALGRYEDLAFVYNAFELCCVLRPFAHEYFFHEKHADRLLFLDSDILLLSDAWAPFEKYADSSIVLSPHICTATDIELVKVIDLSLLQTGVFNGGVIQLNRCDETMRILEWFKARQLRYGFYEMKSSSDQIWLNLVPLLFAEYRILKDAGVNVGWWNLHERSISISSDGAWKVEKADLHSVHFSHWSPLRPDVVSRVCPEIKAPKEWYELSKLYSDLCLNAGYATSSQTRYRYGFFDSGAPVESWMRLTYAEMLESGNAFSKSPFQSFDYFARLSKRRHMRECRSHIGACIQSARRCLASGLRAVFPKI